MKMMQHPERRHDLWNSEPAGEEVIVTELEKGNSQIMVSGMETQSPECDK